MVLGVPARRELPVNASFFPFPVAVQIGRRVIDGGRQRNKGAEFILHVQMGVSDLEFISWHHGRFPDSTAIDEGSVSGIQILHQHRPLNHVKPAMQIANPRIGNPNVGLGKASQNDAGFV